MAAHSCAFETTFRRCVRGPYRYTARSGRLYVLRRTLFSSPKPMRSMTSLFRGGSGGSNAMVPRFSTPTGTVTSTAAPAPLESLTDKSNIPGIQGNPFAVRVNHMTHRHVEHCCIPCKIVCCSGGFCGNRVHRVVAMLEMDSHGDNLYIIYT